MAVAYGQQPSEGGEFGECCLQAVSDVRAFVAGPILHQIEGVPLQGRDCHAPFRGFETLDPIRNNHAGAHQWRAGKRRDRGRKDEVFVAEWSEGAHARRSDFASRRSTWRHAFRMETSCAGFAALHPANDEYNVFSATIAAFHC